MLPDPAGIKPVTFWSPVRYTSEAGSVDVIKQDYMNEYFKIVTGDWSQSTPYFWRIQEFWPTGLKGLTKHYDELKQLG